MAKVKRAAKNKKSTINKTERYVLSVTLAMAVVGTIGMWMLATSSAASCTVSNKLVNSCRPWVGAWANQYPQVANGKDQILFHEQRVGKKADFIHSYHPAGSNRVNDAEKHFYARANTYLFVNWKPTNDWGAGGGSNASVNSGIDQFAKDIKALGSKKVLLTVFHEPENDVSGGASGCSYYKGGSGTPAEYRAMWKNVRNRFDAQGVGNVVWAMNYMGFSQWDCMVDDLWPGNDLVDWVMYDPYGNGKNTYDTAIGRFYDFLKNNSSSTRNYNSKPWGLGEYATHSSTDAQKRQFYEDAKRSLEANKYPNLKLYVMFDSVGTSGDHRISYNAAGQYAPSSADAYKRFVNSPVFNVSSTTPTVPAPPQPDSSDKTPPSVTLTTPKTGAKVSGKVSMRASASDNKGVKGISFIVNGSWHSTDSKSPYTGTLDTTKLKNGTHTVRARAWDTSNNYKDGTSVIITVSNTKSSSGSVSGSTAKPGNAPAASTDKQTKTATVKDIRQMAATGIVPIKGVLEVKPTNPGTSVEVKVNGKKVDGNSIDTTKLTDGTHQLEVKEGEKTESVTIQVDNPWYLEVRNEVSSKPAAYAAGGGGSLAALAGGGFWVFRRFGWPF